MAGATVHHKNNIERKKTEDFIKRKDKGGKMSAPPPKSDRFNFDVDFNEGLVEIENVDDILGGF